MQPSDRHSREARMARIQDTRENEEITKFARTLPKTRPGNAVVLVPGLEFVSQVEIRTVPKVRPRGMSAMKSALAKSVVWKPGTRFRILAKAARTGKKQITPYYRVSVLELGKVVYTGFMIESATYGGIEVIEPAA